MISRPGRKYRRKLAVARQLRADRSQLREELGPRQYSPAPLETCSTCVAYHQVGERTECETWGCPVNGQGWCAMFEAREQEPQP